MGEFATMGRVVHAVAELVGGDSGVDDADIAKRLDEIWDDLDFRSAWYSAKQRKQAEEMVGKFLAWHRRAGARELVSIEEPFSLDLGRVKIRGRIDRAERARTRQRDKDRVLVVDAREPEGQCGERRGGLLGVDLEHAVDRGVKRLCVPPLPGRRVLREAV